MLALRARVGESQGKSDHLAVDGVEVARTLSVKAAETLLTFGQITLTYNRKVQKSVEAVDAVMQPAEPATDQNQAEADQPMVANEEEVEEQLQMLVFATETSVSLLSASP